MNHDIKNLAKGTILLDEPMSKHTSYGIGGPARAYVTPKNKFSKNYSGCINCIKIIKKKLVSTPKKTVEWGFTEMNPLYLMLSYPESNPH